MEDNKKTIGKSFDEMFGDAQEFVPNPTDIVEGEFDALDEEDGDGEDTLANVDCTGIATSEVDPNEDAAEEDDEEDDEDLEPDANEGLSDGTPLVSNE